MAPCSPCVQIRVAHADLTALSERARSATENEVALRATVDTLEARLAAYHATVESATSERATAVATAADAQRKLHELEVDCAVLVATIEAQKTAAEENEAQRRALRQEKLDLRQETNESRHALAASETRLRLALDEVR